jgi:hypothetical protein
MTKIENLWKNIASQLKIYHKFSIDTFHGKSECACADKYMEKLLLATYCIYYDDNDDDDYNNLFVELDEIFY